MHIADKLEEARKLSIWVTEHTNDREFRDENNIAIGISILQLSLDIYDGILLLVEKNMPGPAFVMVRSLFESYVRGIWLLESASNQEIDNFVNGIYPKLQSMVKKISDDIETGGAWIKANYESNSSAFSNLTHGGEQHYLRRVRDGAIEPNYPMKELESLINFSQEIQIRVGVAILSVQSNAAALDELSNIANKIRSKQ